MAVCANSTVGNWELGTLLSCFCSKQSRMGASISHWRGFVNVWLEKTDARFSAPMSCWCCGLMPSVSPLVVQLRSVPFLALCVADPSPGLSFCSRFATKWGMWEHMAKPCVYLAPSLYLHVPCLYLGIRLGSLFFTSCVRSLFSRPAILRKATCGKKIQIFIPQPTSAAVVRWRQFCTQQKNDDRFMGTHAVMRLPKKAAAGNSDP